MFFLQLLFLSFTISSLPFILFFSQSIRPSPPLPLFKPFTLFPSLSLTPHPNPSLPSPHLISPLILTLTLNPPLLPLTSPSLLPLPPLTLSPPLNHHYVLFLNSAFPSPSLSLPHLTPLPSPISPLSPSPQNLPSHFKTATSPQFWRLCWR